MVVHDVLQMWKMASAGKLMIVIANLIGLGVALAFQSVSLIANHSAVMIAIGVTCAIPNGIWRTLLYVVPVGCGTVIIIFFRFDII